MTTNRKHSLLWELRQPSGPGSYLYGTMHVRDKRAFRYVEHIKPFLNRCDIFAAELPLNHAISIDIVPAAQLPEGKNLVDYLGEKQYSRIRKSIWRAFGIHLDDYRQLRPLILTSIITESVLSWDYREGLDQYLWNYAGKTGKQCTGLESLDYQIRLLERIPIGFQIRMLKNIARNTPKFRKHILKTVTMYECGDVNNVYRQTRKYLGIMRKWLLYDRNEIMAQRISSMVKEHSVFATFGAGHLAGSKGIIRLLKNKGYEVLPVKLN